MTAINVLLQPDAAHIFSDAAWYDLAGFINWTASKVHPVVHWPGAVASRGTWIAAPIIAQELTVAFDTFDAFADNAADFLLSWCLRNLDHLRTWGDQGHVELCAIGWSHSLQAPRGLFVTSRNEVQEAATAGVNATGETLLLDGFTVHEILGGYVKPMPTDEALSFYGVSADADLATLPSIEAYGTGIVCAQRELREPLEKDGEAVCFVGGYVVHAKVTRDGVTLKRVARFPDAVGERMDAKRADVILSPGSFSTSTVVATSEFERRAAEKRARKEARRASR